MSEPVLAAAPAAPAAARQGELLVRLARFSLVATLAPQLEPKEPACTTAEAGWLGLPGATFVTLMQHGRLRGCIGTLHAHRPLREDVTRNARAAALEDPRFRPLVAAELDLTEVEVSLLAPPQPVEPGSEEEVLARLRPGEDGVLLEFEHHRGTFLPQVWDTFPEPREFLRRLRQKAGLPADFWHPSLRLSRYSVSKWRERDGLA